MNIWPINSKLLQIGKSEGEKQVERFYLSEQAVNFTKITIWSLNFSMLAANDLIMLKKIMSHYFLLATCLTSGCCKDTHPPDLLLPPRPGTVPPILTWPAPTAPGMVTVPGSSLPISMQHTNRAGQSESELSR